jgi:hypothetical protein
VAQDLSDPTITARAKVGWAHVWDKVFDWHNDTLIVDNVTPANEKEPYALASMRELGTAMREGMAMAGKSRAYIGLAVVFFVVYWLVAGPGLYVYLVAKARAHASWFFFALSAVIATVLTVLLVQLIVRGPPELQHVTLVKQASGQPAVVYSRFGLYIKHDGLQDIALAGTDPTAESYITAFADHPEHLSESGPPAPARQRYTVPIHEAGSADRIAVEIPYRTTLKKLQAKWVGQMNAGIGGSAIVTYTDYTDNIRGLISNGTGLALKNIYIAYRPMHLSDPYQRDRVLYLPSWDSGVSIDLAKAYAAALNLAIPGDPANQSSALPEQGKSVKGMVASELGWPLYWYSAYRGGNMGLENLSVNDQADAVPRSFPLLSFFDRLPPARNPKRFELLRRGARQFDISSAISAGELIVLAEAENAAMPIPLEVNGQQIAGTGTTYYQFVLPLDYVQVDDSGQPVNAPDAGGAATSPATPSVEK